MDTQTKTKTQTQLRNAFGKFENLELKIDQDTVGDIYFAFGHFFPENEIYSPSDLNKPYSKGSFFWKNKQEFISYVKEKTGIEIKGNDKTSIKKAQGKFFDIAEGKITEATTSSTEHKEPSITNSVTPDSGAREVHKSEFEYRKSETQKSKEVAQEKVENLIERLEKIKGRKIWAKPKNPENPLPTVTLSNEQSQKLYEISKLSSTEIEKNIRLSLPQDRPEDYSDQIIQSAVQKTVDSSAIFSRYQTADQIPLTYPTPSLVSPMTALLDENSPIFKETFSDPQTANIVKNNVSYSLLQITVANDLEREVVSNWLGSPEAASVIVGGSEIVPYTLSSEETPNGIEITTGDLKTLVQEGNRVKSFFLENFSVDNSNIPSPSGFTSFKIPEEKIVEETLKSGKPKLILGGIGGEKNQGDLARAYARERVRLASLKPLEVGISIADSTAPITVQVAGVGRSTESLLSFMNKNKIPLILTSVSIGSYAASELAATRAISGLWGGKPLLFIGAGKYNFQFVNAANYTLGGVPMARFTLGFQLGSTSFNLEFTKKAGQIISSTLIKSTGGVVTRTALPAFFTKILAALGGATGPVGLAVSIGIGWLVGQITKLIGKIIPPEKLKAFLESSKEVIFGSGLALTFLVGGFAGMAAGIPLMIIGGASAISAGGFSTAGLSSAVAGAVNISRIVLLTAWQGIAGPILFIFLGFPIVVALILFIINSGAYLVPPSLITIENIASPYIGVEKVANPTGPFENSELPLKITYTVTITAKKEALSNLQITNKCEVVTKAGSQPCQAPPIVKNEPISVGSAFTTTYDVIYNSTYKDAIVIDTISVTADTTNSGSQSSSGSASITIGDPPTECLSIDGDWPSNYKASMESARATLVGKYGNYVSKVCSSFTKISLLYESGANGNYWGWNDLQSSGIATIHFYKPSFGSSRDTLYILAHELGHSLASGAKTAFIQATYSAFSGIKSEAPYCFYSDTFNWNEYESMPEAIALRVIEPSCGNVQQKWPIHFRFLQQYVFN